MAALDVLVAQQTVVISRGDELWAMLPNVTIRLGRPIDMSAKAMAVLLGRSVFQTGLGPSGLFIALHLFVFTVVALLCHILRLGMVGGKADRLGDRYPGDGGVEPQGVECRHHRLPARQRRHARALDRVAGVEQRCIGAGQARRQGAAA